MTAAARILGLFCLLLVVVLSLLGLYLRLLVAPFGPTTFLAVAAHVLLVFLIGNLLLSIGKPLPENEPARVSLSKHGDVAEEDEKKSEEGSKEETKEESKEAENKNNYNDADKEDAGAADAEEGQSFLEYLETRSSFPWLLMSAVLFLDLVYLVLGLAVPEGRMFGANLDLHTTLLGTNLAAFFFAAKFGDKNLTAGGRLLVYLLLSAHIVLISLSRDTFAASALSLVLACWVLVYERGFLRKAAACCFVVLTFWVVSLLSETGLFDSLFALDWLCPMSGPLLGFDVALKASAYIASGDFGLGPEFVAVLDFPAPGYMVANGLFYLAALWGFYGVQAYSLLTFVVLIALFWIMLRSLALGETRLLAPFWGLVAANQYVTMALFLGWRAYGRTHGPAFVGGTETGLEILVFFYLLLRAIKVKTTAGAAPSGGPGDSGGTVRG
ncbi:MAG: hypothetical protein LBO05_12995 [Deltaproteobacteria bacterium]|nr:hypothetical protein [Deltaproteobacteria bacterium]